MDALHGVNPLVAVLSTLVLGLVMFFAKGFFRLGKQRVDEAHRKVATANTQIAELKLALVTELAGVRADVVKGHSRTKERQVEVITELRLLTQRIEGYTQAVTKLEGKVEQNTVALAATNTHLALLNQKTSRLFEIVLEPETIRKEGGSR